jgi:hypothetical protein
MHFGIIQLGICLALNNKSYSTYTVYLFPRSIREGSFFLTRMISMDCDAMDFNRTHGAVDFNKWISSGVQVRFYPR